MVTVSNEVWLHDKFSNREWFDSVGRDQFGRLTLYVKYMSLEVLTEVPLDLGGRVLIHFADSKSANANQFKVQPQKNIPSPVPPVHEESYETLIEPDDKVIESIDDMCTELDRLEKLCGSNILQDIFYEVHDGSNAVTNLSARYPEVRSSVEKLYDEYGFDLIYEELDG